MHAQVDAPLTFEAMEAGATVTYTMRGSKPIQYSLNGGAWTDYSATILLSNVGDKVSFRGNNATYNSNSAKFNCSKDCYIYGNIMSLVDATDYATANTLSSTHAFYQLFKNNTHIKNHPSNDLVLPATTLTNYCYSQMFYGCMGLTRVSALPATTISNGGYQSMLSGCTGLTSLPANLLPATTLDGHCYYQMFFDCTGLTNAPELPATTLAAGCYREMFKNCTGLTNAPTLPAASLVTNCYLGTFSGCSNLSSVTCYATSRANADVSQNWLEGVAETGTFYAPTNGVLNNEARGVSSIPDGWNISNFTTPTGIEIVTGNPSPVTEKILKDGHVIIIRNGVEYTVEGQTIK